MRAAGREKETVDLGQIAREAAERRRAKDAERAARSANNAEARDTQPPNPTNEQMSPPDEKGGIVETVRSFVGKITG